MDTHVFMLAVGPAYGFEAACLAVTLMRHQVRPIVLYGNLPDRVLYQLEQVSTPIVVPKLADRPRKALLSDWLARYDTGLLIDTDSAALEDCRPLLAAVTHRDGFYAYVQDAEHEARMPDEPRMGLLRGRPWRWRVIGSLLAWSGANGARALRRWGELFASTDQHPRQEELALAAVLEEFPQDVRRGLTTMVRRTWPQIATHWAGAQRGPFFASVRTRNEPEQALAALDPVSPIPRRVWDLVRQEVNGA